MAEGLSSSSLPYHGSIQTSSNIIMEEYSTTLYTAKKGSPTVQGLEKWRGQASARASWSTALAIYNKESLRSNWRFVKCMKLQDGPIRARRVSKLQSIFNIRNSRFAMPILSKYRCYSHGADSVCIHVGPVYQNLISAPERLAKPFSLALPPKKNH